MTARYTPFDAQEWLEAGPMTERHYGPGPHPGTGTEQEVHAGDGGHEARRGRKIRTSGERLKPGIDGQVYYTSESIGRPRSIATVTRRIVEKSEEELLRRDADEPEMAFTVSDRVELQKVGDTTRHSIGGAGIEWLEIESRQMAGDVMTHNHPSGTSFSPEDILFASMWGLAEMRAVGPDSKGNRWRYRYQPGSQRPNPFDQGEKAWFASKIHAVSNDVRGEWSDAAHATKENLDWASHNHSHEVMRRLAYSHPEMVGYYSRERLP